MSWLKALVVASLLAFSVEAAAGGRVDWSDYIDHDAKPTPRAGSFTSTSEPAPVAPKKVKATKASKKKVANKNRKARSKKARRK
jgi:hypothetical protein